jgi:hypothetical protein
MRPGEIVAGLGGAILLLSLSLEWYSVGGRELSAWEAMSVLDVLLALIAVLALAVPLVAAPARGPAQPMAIEVIASVVCAIAVLLVVFRLLDHPGGLLSGAWLGLAGSVLAWSGAWMALRDESTPGATLPDVPRRPVPTPNITPDAEP